MYILNITCVMYGILHMRSDGNSAVKIEGGGGQRLYLYTVKIPNFRQMLMSSLIWGLFLSQDLVRFFLVAW